MSRLACLFVVAAGCSSGFTTDAASMTQLSVKSSAATSFVGADGNGTTVMGWTINLYSDAPGADCKDQNVIPVASIGIYTNQMQDATHKKAMLQVPSDITIVTMSPPPVNGSSAATMGADGFNMIGGIVSISNFHLRADLSADLIEGTVNAAGTDKNGTAQSITGMFKAPVCE